MRIPFLSRRKQRKTREQWSLQAPLLTWSREDAWTIGDAVTGTLVTGATGSGKTSGPARAIATTFLRSGFGGLVLTTKPDERAMWEAYCAETGRTQDLRVFGPDSQPWRFNPLEHELKRAGAGAGLTENILNLLCTALEVSDRGSNAGGGREDSNYWRQATRTLLRNSIDLLAMGLGRVSVPELHRLIISAATSLEMLRSEEWRSRSFCLACLKDADKREKTRRQAADFELVADFFMVQWPTLAEKTRSVVLSTCTSMIDVLNRSLLRDLLCGETTVSPESTEEGAIIVLDLPVKEFGEVGVIAQTIWKYAFMRSIERRDVSRNARPVFLFADEFQHFATSYDALFQTTCRSARVATVYLTQNISNVHAALGGNEKAKVEATSLFGNLCLKVLLANADPTTNEWASSLIGKSLQVFANGNSSRTSDGSWGAAAGFDLFGGSSTASAGFSEHYELEVQPREFTRLRTGGVSNGFQVDAVVFQNGRVFRAGGRSWLPVTFEQSH
jgi:hypothetical protein